MFLSFCVCVRARMCVHACACVCVCVSACITAYLCVAVLGAGVTVLGTPVLHLQNRSLNTTVLTLSAPLHQHSITKHACSGMHRPPSQRPTPRFRCLSPRVAGPWHVIVAPFAFCLLGSAASAHRHGADPRRHALHSPPALPAPAGSTASRQQPEPCPTAARGLRRVRGGPTRAARRRAGAVGD